MARTVDLEYDENVGNAPTPACHLSFDAEQDFVISTAKALPWEDPADGNQDKKVVRHNLSGVLAQNGKSGRPS